MQSGKKSNIEASVKHSGVLIAEAIDCFGKNKKKHSKSKHLSSVSLFRGSGEGAAVGIKQQVGSSCVT